MRAVTFDRFGGPEVLHLSELPVPAARAGEVVVRIVGATINPTDINMRNGSHAAMMTGIVPPYIGGMEFSGRVQALGEGVTRLAVGQPVIGIVNPRRQEGGGYADYLRVPAASLAPVPPNADLIAAATIPMNGLTAKMALEALAVPRGGSILVTGGAGALGGYVIQLARKLGLRTICDAKESDRALLQQLGADDLVPRGAAMAEAVRARYPQGVDGLVDCAILGAPASELVRTGCAVATVRRTQAAPDSRLRHCPISVLEQATNTAALEWLARCFVEGELTARVAKRMPPEQAVEAFRAMEAGGLRGRVVLVFDHA